MALHRCPAFEGGPNWKQRDIFDVPCPDCGTEVEFWKDDASQECPDCGRDIQNPYLIPVALE